MMKNRFESLLAKNSRVYYVRRHTNGDLYIKPRSAFATARYSHFSMEDNILSDVNVI